jgi:hypothetical protein
MLEKRVFTITYYHLLSFVGVLSQRVWQGSETPTSIGDHPDWARGRVDTCGRKITNEPNLGQVAGKS